jgi:hypothetical protein
MIPVEEVYNESKTFLKVPHLKIFNVFKLNPAERIVFSVILSRCSTSKFESCHRSIPELVQDTHGFCGYVTVSKAITRLRELNLISSDNLYGNNRTATYYVNTDKVIQIQKMSDDELNTVIVPEKKSKGQKRNPATEKQSPEVINPRSIATKENSNVSELNDNDLPPYNQENFDINSYFGEPCSNSPYENAPVDTNQMSDIPQNSLYVQDVTTKNTFTPETVTSIPPAVSNVPAVQPPVQEEEKPKQKRFVKPTLQEITEVMAVKIREKYGSNVQDALINDQAENFLNYYESNGWRVGKNPMKNWHCAIGNWIKNIKTYSTAGTGTSGALIVATAEQSSHPDFDTIYKEVIDIAGKLQNRSNWLSESANKNIMAGVRTFIAEEIKAHWNLYGESDWKNALNVFIFAQKSPLRYLDPNFCKNNGFDSGLYNEFWTGSTFFIPRSSDEPTVTEQVIESEHFQKSLQEDLERKRRVSEFKKKLNAHREEMAHAYK